MKQIISFFLFSLLLSSCYKMINEPGLKGRVKEYTDYKMHIECLEDDNSTKDTLYITTTKLNRKGKIMEFTQLSVHLNKTNSYINTFNPQGRIIKRIGHFDDKEIKVEYFYKDTLLQKSYSKNEIDNGIYEMIEQYYYNDKAKLLKKIISNTIIENKDTVSSINWIYKFDSNELLYEATLIQNNALDSVKKTTYKYKYDDSKLPLKTIEFDENDNIIVTNEYKYRFDKNGSCIEIEEYENDTLLYLTVRKIEYQ